MSDCSEGINKELWFRGTEYLDKTFRHHSSDEHSKASQLKWIEYFQESWLRSTEYLDIFRNHGSDEQWISMMLSGIMTQTNKIFGSILSGIMAQMNTVFGWYFKESWLRLIVYFKESLLRLTYIGIIFSGIKTQISRVFGRILSGIMAQIQSIWVILSGIMTDEQSIWMTLSGSMALMNRAFGGYFWESWLWWIEYLDDTFRNHGPDE